MSDPEKKLIQAYAAKIIQGQMDFLEDQIADIGRHGDINILHQTRVISRRVRNTIEVFARYFGKKNSRKWLSSFSELTKKLTSVRDMDVQISFLQNELTKVDNPKVVQGLQRILLRKTQKRNDSAGLIDKTINKFNETETIKSVREFIVNHPFVEEEFSTTASLSSLAIQNIEENIEKCFLHVPFIISATNNKELHKLRKSIKNLRYTLELFQYLYPALIESIDILKTFQDDLGKIHDCDVWIEDLNKFEIKEKKRIFNFYGQNGAFNFIKPGVDFLRAQIGEARMQAYNQFLLRWNQSFQNQFWAKLRNQLTAFPIYEDRLPKGLDSLRVPSNQTDLSSK